MLGSRFLNVSIRDQGRIAQGASRFLNKVEDAAVGSLVSKTDPALWNGYTGLKPSAFGNIAAIGAVGAYAAYTGLRAHDKPVTSKTDFNGTAPIMGGGAVKSNAPTLGASGGLVFGLNSMRGG
jgi:hypothetical protein